MKILKVHIWALKTYSILAHIYNFFLLSDTNEGFVIQYVINVHENNWKQAVKNALHLLTRLHVVHSRKFPVQLVQVQ
jgi:hypothetical protein